MDDEKILLVIASAVQKASVDDPLLVPGITRGLMRIDTVCPDHAPGLMSCPCVVMPGLVQASRTCPTCAL